MTPQTAKNILAFLERVQLTGKEAIAWCEACAHLNAIIDAPALPVPNHPGTGLPDVAAPIAEDPAPPTA